MRLGAATSAPALGEDFNRVGSKLSAQTASRGAPEYAPLSYIFKAVADGSTIGEAIVTLNWGKLELDLMHVEPEHRGKGIGKSLIRAIENFAKSNGLTAIRLNSPTWQGVGFYEKCGYNEMGRIPLNSDVHGNPHFEVTYVKVLK
jgi:GNAT superfamily N-acetyltransferase